MLQQKTRRRSNSIYSKDIVKNNRYTVRFARNQAEVRAALELRFLVFNLELGEGLPESYQSGMDTDKYDKQCDHLIVIENSSDTVVGTYRMQSSNQAIEGEGFYTSEEFHLNQLPEKVLNNAIELGRACIRKDHRSGRVLYLLWRGMAAYLKEMNKRYLFGCCSVTSQDPCLGFSIEEYLRENNYYHPKFFAETKKDFICERSEKVNLQKIESSRELPPLFKMYLELGTLVCSPPALDKKFKTIDFLILLDIEHLNEKSKALFF